MQYFDCEFAIVKGHFSHSKMYSFSNLDFNSWFPGDHISVTWLQFSLPYG